jgi:hypothetical protein
MLTLCRPERGWNTRAVWYVLLIVAPFVIGAILGRTLARNWWSAGAVCAAGLAIGAACIVFVWLSAPLSSRPDYDCGDCGAYLGHWWEPESSSASPSSGTSSGCSVSEPESETGPYCVLRAKNERGS